MYPEIDPLVEEEIKVEIGEVIIIEAITDTITEIDQEADGTIIGQLIGVTITRLTIDEVTLDKITDKVVNEHLETEVKVRNRARNYNNEYMRGRSRDMEIMIGPFSQEIVCYLMVEMNLGPDPTLG